MKGQGKTIGVMDKMDTEANSQEGKNGLLEGGGFGAGG